MNEEFTLEVLENEGEEMIILKLPLIVEKNSVRFMQMDDLKMTLKTIMKIFCKYHGSFSDGSEDYVGEDNIDMTEVIMF